MGDALWCALNIFYYHWLIKKPNWPIEPGGNPSKNVGKKKAESGTCHQAAQGTTCLQIGKSYEPHGNA